MTNDGFDEFVGLKTLQEKKLDCVLQCVTSCKKMGLFISLSFPVINQYFNQCQGIVVVLFSTGMY